MKFFTQASDECCLKQNQTKLTKSNTKFLKSSHSHIDFFYINNTKLGHQNKGHKGHKVNN